MNQAQLAQLAAMPENYDFRINDERFRMIKSPDERIGLVMGVRVNDAWVPIVNLCLTDESVITSVRWVPQMGEHYYHLDIPTEGNNRFKVKVSKCTKSSYDRFNLVFNNCFATEEEAENDVYVRRTVEALENRWWGTTIESGEPEC